MLWLSGVLITLAWGVAAFGSPYPWAYSPLLAASTVLGVAGLWLGRTTSRPASRLQIGFISIALAVSIQLVPIPVSWLAALSPHASSVLMQHSLEFSMRQSPYHSLSIDASRTQLGLAFFAAFGVLLLGTGRVLRRETSYHLAATLVILGAIVATVGIVQRATFNGKIYGFWENVQHGLVFGPFVNRNHFAGWMLMVIPVGLGYLMATVYRGVDSSKPGLRNFLLWLSSESASRAVLTSFAILVMVLSLVLTMSRSGMLALLAAMVAAVMIMGRRQSATSRRAAVGYLICLMVAVVSWVGLDQIAARFAEADITSINERPAMWADTIRIAKDFWLTGTGLNTFGISTLFYQTSVPGQHLREAHSDYLQLAAEGGLLLAIPSIISVAAFVRTLRRRLREDVGSIWWIRVGATTGLIAVALQSSVEFSLQMPGNAVMFAVVAGLAIHDSTPPVTGHRS
jgi:hypothetical protein